MNVMEMERSLYEWPASYYNWGSKRWKYGLLRLQRMKLQFVENTQHKNDPTHIQINLDSITEVKKSSSTFMFKCLVILAKEAQHWFSSLPARDATYTVITHFWKERLLGAKNNQRKVLPTQGTQLGRELLGIAEDSNVTLEKAARTLHRQGEQLDHSLGVMFDLHADLDVAERLTGHLEGWFGQWGHCRATGASPEALMLVDGRGLPIIHEFPVIYHRGVHDPRRPAETKVGKHLSSGFLRVSREGLTVLDEGQKPSHHYEPRDISTVTVLSPWKFNIVQYRLGEPDMDFAITSARADAILEVMHPVYGPKMDLRSPEEAPAAGVEGAPGSLPPAPGSPPPPPAPQVVGHPQRSGITAWWSAWKASRTPTQGANVTHVTSKADLLGHSQPQVPKQHQVAGQQPQRQEQQVAERPQAGITDQEADELSNMLGRMKSMALDINSEQSRQLGTIDKLTDTVDDANFRLKEDTRRLQKLL